jgi:hypothetical protein
LQHFSIARALFNQQSQQQHYQYVCSQAKE